MVCLFKANQKLNIKKDIPIAFALFMYRINGNFEHFLR